MSNNYDEYFKLKKFIFWNFLIDKITYKNTFIINISKHLADKLDTINILAQYRIEFDGGYLVSRPQSDIIAKDIMKSNMPNAYFAHIIDQAEKNEAIVSLQIYPDIYRFTFTF